MKHSSLLIVAGLVIGACVGIGAYHVFSTKSKTRHPSTPRNPPSTPEAAPPQRPVESDHEDGTPVSTEDTSSLMPDDDETEDTRGAAISDALGRIDIIEDIDSDHKIAQTSGTGSQEQLAVLSIIRGNRILTMVGIHDQETHKTARRFYTDGRYLDASETVSDIEARSAEQIQRYTLRIANQVRKADREHRECLSYVGDTSLFHIKMRRPTSTASTFSKYILIALTPCREMVAQLGFDHVDVLVQSAGLGHVVDGDCDIPSEEWALRVSAVVDHALHAVTENISSEAYTLFLEELDTERAALTEIFGKGFTFMAERPNT